MNEPDTASDTRRRRLLYRATHRGTKEADRLVGDFVAQCLAALTDTEIDALEAIIDLPDVDLAEWLCGRRPIPPEQDNSMLTRMRAAAGR